MKVKKIMTEHPVCAVPETPLRAVAHIMFEKNCGAVPIVENFDTMKPVGIVTDRDITVNTVAFNKDPLNMTAAEIMSFPVLTVRPDTSMDDCFEIMEDNKVRRIIVVNDDGAVCGVVAQADIARFADEEEIAEFVRDISKPRARMIGRGTAVAH